MAASVADAAPDPIPPRAGTVEVRRVVGEGPTALAAGADTLRDWAMHERAGVRTDGSPLEAGQTVGIAARTFGVWMRFACRVTDVENGPNRIGFTYATLPGHPERGRETFLLELRGDGRVELTISARSSAGWWVTRLAGPVARILQRRFTERYAAAMAVEVAQRTSAIS